MVIQFNPEVEEKLNALASVSGRGAEELVQDAVAGLLEEVAQAREMLDSRYDDLKTGRVKPIPGDEVAAYFRAKSAAARRSRPKS
jgi:predicted DNA-binding protein